VVDRIKQTKLRPLTPEQRQQVVDMYRAGVPVKEIVRQTGVNRSTVYRLRGQAGLERNHRFTDDDRAQAILLRQQGLTIADIPQGVTAAAVSVVPPSSKSTQSQLGHRIVFATDQLKTGVPSWASHHGRKNNTGCQDSA